MPIIWTVAIDWNRKGDFNGTNEDVLRIQPHDGSTTHTPWAGWSVNLKPVTPLMY